MPGATDFLKSFRDKGYSSSSKPDDKEGMDSGKQNESPRTIKFTDDEQKMFEQAKPGEDLACEVHGSLTGDGSFRIMSVAPLGGGSSYGQEDENQMAQQVAQRMTPSVQLSPS